MNDTSVVEIQGKFVRRLERSEDESFRPNDDLGGKGSSLARLISAGFPVPRTGVVTTASYHAIAHGLHLEDRLVGTGSAQSTLSADDVDALFDDVELSPELAAQIIALAQWVGDGQPIAVRSSATVEDLHGSSFAGQYSSFLNVDSTDEKSLLQTVKRVWASLWHPAPVAYREAFGFTDVDAAMAVVFMQMIPAQKAGVIFTADPGGEANACRVEQVDGLGESLVSGERTPDAWVVQRSDFETLPSSARRALETSLEIEAYFEVPQDIEWAATDTDVFIVQARPITALEDNDGFDSPIDDHELTTAGIAEMVPGVLPPLLWEVNHYLLGEAFRSFLDNLGILHGSAVTDPPFVRRIRGRAAIDFDQLRQAAASVPGAIEELERAYFRSSTTPPGDGDQGNRWVRRWRSSVSDLRTLRTTSAITQQSDVLIRAVDLVSPGELETRSDADLMAYDRRLLDLAARCLSTELGIAAIAAAAYEDLVRVLTGYFGADVAANSAQLLTRGATVGVTRPATSSAALFAGPTWNELSLTPAEILGTRQSAEEAQDQQKGVEAQMLALPGWQIRRVLTGQVVDLRLHRFRRLVRRAREYLWRREAMKSAVLRLGGEARRVHGEYGRRLVLQGVLADTGDIEVLTTGEIAAALSGSLHDGSDVVRRRQNWVRRYTVEGPLPLRFVGLPDRETAPLPDGHVIDGWASSPGRYTGRAKAITGPGETLQLGDVLVAEATDASWSPLFLKAGAVVVERGGPLSHAAILARELGVPAVLNVEQATRLLDGHEVTVDGDEGVVVIVGEDPDDAETRGATERSVSS